MLVSRAGMQCSALPQQLDSTVLDQRFILSSSCNLCWLRLLWLLWFSWLFGVTEPRLTMLSYHFNLAAELVHPLLRSSCCKEPSTLSVVACGIQQPVLEPTKMRGFFKKLTTHLGIDCTALCLPDMCATAGWTKHTAGRSIQTTCTAISGVDTIALGQHLQRQAELQLTVVLAHIRNPLSPRCIAQLMAIQSCSMNMSKTQTQKSCNLVVLMLVERSPRRQGVLAFALPPGPMALPLPTWSRVLEKPWNIPTEVVELPAAAPAAAPAAPARLKKYPTWTFTLANCTEQEKDQLRNWKQVVRMCAWLEVKNNSQQLQGCVTWATSKRLSQVKKFSLRAQWLHATAACFEATNKSDSECCIMIDNRKRTIFRKTFITKKYVEQLRAANIDAGAAGAAAAEQEDAAGVELSASRPGNKRRACVHELGDECKRLCTKLMDACTHPTASCGCGSANEMQTISERLSHVSRAYHELEVECQRLKKQKEHLRKVVRALQQ